MMITQSTDVRGALGARRRARAMREASRDDVMRASPFGLSLGIGLGIGSALDDSNAFVPTGVAGCVAFWDPMIASKLTYGTTPRSSGSGTPPGITFSYATVATPTAIRIEATGTTTWKWGPENDGTTANFAAGGSGLTIVPGATVALGSTGVSAIFPASGTYANGQAWQTTLASITAANSAHVLAMATAAKQPLFLKLLTAVGTPAADQYGWQFDGTDDTLRCSTIDRPAPNVTPTFYWGAYRPDRNGVNFDTIVAADDAANGRILVGRSFGSRGSYMTNGTTVSTIAGSAAFGRHYASFTGSAADVQRWGSAAAGTPASAGVNDPASGITYGSRGEAATTFSADSWLFAGIWDQVWSAGDISSGDTYITARDGAGLV